MTAIKVNKTNLLAVLKANREKHREIFLEAQDGYRKAVITELDSMLADARGGKKIRRSLSLIEPMDQTKDYDRAIGMLEMSIDETIELEELQYKCYVLDDWSWKGQWTHSNRSYTSKLDQME